MFPFSRHSHTHTVVIAENQFEIRSNVILLSLVLLIRMHIHLAFQQLLRDIPAFSSLYYTLNGRNQLRRASEHRLYAVLERNNFNRAHIVGNLSGWMWSRAKLIRAIQKRQICSSHNRKIEGNATQWIRSIYCKYVRRSHSRSMCIRAHCIYYTVLRCLCKHKNLFAPEHSFAPAANVCQHS